MRDRSKNQVTLAVIRHGETQANKEHRYLGKTDEPLSKNGIEALLSYQKLNIYPDVDYLFISPMKRCIETAGILYPKLCPVVIPEWEEIDFGQFEYRNYEELKDDARYQAWIDSGGILAFPEGESREKFILRCKTGLARMCSELRNLAGQEASGPLRAGLVVHGGTVMALLSAYSKKSYLCQCHPRHKRFLKTGTSIRCIHAASSMVRAHPAQKVCRAVAKTPCSYFDYQVSNGRGYLCRMENWYSEIISEKNNVRIEVVREV